MRARLEAVSSNGGRKIAVFEAQNFDDGRLIIFLILGKSTLQSPVSYSVTKKFRKKKSEISSEWRFKVRSNIFIRAEFLRGGKQVSKIESTFCCFFFFCEGSITSELHTLMLTV